MSDTYTPVFPNHSHMVQPIYEAILRESERGAVMVACSIIDQCLVDNLKRIRPDNIKEKDYNGMLNGSGPFSSLYAKLNILYICSIISYQLYNSINFIRDVRNKAAHSFEGFELRNFKDQMIKSQKEFGANAISNLSLKLNDFFYSRGCLRL